MKNILRSKKSSLIILALILLSLVIIFISIRSNQSTNIKVEEYLSQFFDLKSYASFVQNKTIDEEEDNSKVFYTKDVGTLTTNDKKEVNQFNFLQQKIYKNYKGKWEIFVTAPKFIPGSPEDLLNLKKEEFKFSEVQIRDKNIYCKILKIDNDCVVLQYSKDQIYEFIFTKKSKELKLLRVIDTNFEENKYYFTKINDSSINVAGTFQEMTETIKKDLIIK